MKGTSLSSALLFTLTLAAASVAQAAGSPPMITDDPGVPGDGHWEINLGLSTEKRPGERASELPLIDLNYGVGDHLQFKFEIPYLRLSESGTGSESGFGNSEFGVKWLFLDNGEKGPAMSVYPQIEFNTPGSSADNRGLVEHGAAFKLPFQFQQELGPVTFVAQVGREFRSGGGQLVLRGVGQPRVYRQD